jgi:hypothetical protein
MQEELLASKQKTLGAIEELTKFLPILEEAASVDVAVAEQRGQQKALEVLCTCSTIKTTQF